MIDQKFHQKCMDQSDINEHMYTLKEYASKCSHITECGVRGVVSSYAFASGLKSKNNNKLVQVDIDWNDELSIFKQECINENINVIFYQQSDLLCPIEPTELLFIDTWHVYGQLKRELDRWNTYVSKYIIMHDTTIDAIYGETIRRSHEMDAQKQSIETGIPVEEINKGLWPAIEEFLEQHSEWIIEKRYTHNNGLTILKRNIK